MAKIAKLDQDKAELYNFEYSYTDENGQTVKNKGQVWGNSKKHAEELFSSNLPNGAQDLKITLKSMGHQLNQLQAKLPQISQ